MISYIVRRLLLTIFVLWGVSFIVFAMVRVIPGDPAQVIAGEMATREIVETIRRELGLDKPFLVQYGRFLQDLLPLKIEIGSNWSMQFKGVDLGRSTRTKQPVVQEILDRFPKTMELAVGAMLVATLIGLFVGIISATRPYSLFDNLSMLGALAGVSMPVFWQGLMLMWVFALLLQQWIGWGFPATGRGTLLHLVLPAITLGTSSAAIIARMTRSSLLEVLRQEYIMTARAKGLREQIVTYKHALRNALIPTVTVVGLQFGTLLSGAVLTETVFAWPGVGRLMVESITNRDYPMVQGAVLLVALSFVLVNLLVDLLYAYIDPRIRYD